MPSENTGTSGTQLLLAATGGVLYFGALEANAWWMAYGAGFIGILCYIHIGYLKGQQDTSAPDDYSRGIKVKARVADTSDEDLREDR